LKGAPHGTLPHASLHRTRHPRAPLRATSGRSMAARGQIRRRVRLHKYGKFVQLYTRGGHMAARRFSALVAALARIPARSCVIDGEVVARNTRGLPDFHALHFLRDGREVCVWAFDLL
jgi:hypothetical protein